MVRPYAAKIERGITAEYIKQCEEQVAFEYRGQVKLSVRIAVVVIMDRRWR